MASASVRATTVVETGGTTKSLTERLDILKDSSEKLGIAEVSEPAMQAHFVAVDGKSSNMGFSRAAWWGRFTLHNPGATAVDQIVEFGFPTIDRLEFYRPSLTGTGFQQQLAGDSVVGRSVDIPGRNALFRVTVPPHADVTYYVRLSGDSILAFDVSLHDVETFYVELSRSYDPSILFFGIILAAAFYSFAIFAIVRDSEYLLFSILVIGVGGYFSSIWGYMSAYVLPETTWAANFVISACNCLILFSLTRFTRLFLHLAVYAPKLDLLCRIFEKLSVLVLLISLVDFRLAHSLMFASVIFGFFGSLALSLILWRNKQKYRKLFSLSWLYFCGVLILVPFERFGVLPWGEFYQSLFRISFALICMMFAVLFAEKYRHLTQLKEKELSEARDVAIAASKAKSRFLAMMSHELRTPLNAVIGFADILRLETLGRIGNPKYMEYAQDIKDSGSNLLSTINDLLEISRIEAGQVELDEGPIVVSDLIRRCLRIVTPRATERGLVLESVLEDHLPVLIGDEARIQQVLINLLHNAIKFTPPGGRVRLQVSVTTEGEYYFAISDTGIGIAETDRARILEPFTQVDSHLTRRHDGAGLGLAIAKSILDLHDAALEIVSEIGQGTTFGILFPRQRIE
ncbi:sensor histidine kinase [Govanella unica]|uniref:histidine kinase n=1 Tax=Govanella unica TaxID=2975056 RepID=A0A9X3U1Z0_9PROT|nr:hybrid sensor histidine kinase/response regulator [Govania unica]MDA5194964.1 ATP-binding protein [Govania unica]